MNSKIFRFNNILKLTLIPSIFLVTVNSVSAQQPNSPPLNNSVETDPNSNQPVTSDQNNQPTTDSNSNTNNPTNTNTESPESEPQQLTNNTSNDSQTKTTPQNTNTQKSESFPLLKSLPYIDLPIILVLLLLWFLNKNQQQKLFTQIDKKQNIILGKLNQLDELSRKLNSLDRIEREIIKAIQENNQKIKDSEINLREHLNKHQVSQSVNHQNSSSFTFGYNDVATNQASYGSSNNAIAVFNNIPQFVQTYNQDKNFVANKIIATVAETQESLNQRRSGNSDTVTLENTSQKKYWIVEEDSNYYLIPHSKIKIDDYNIKTLESLFYCVNFISEYSNFDLTKPAKVTQLSSEFWQLEEKGKLEFY